MKDWISASCPVDYVEVFPSSCSGWMRVKGKDNFAKALEHLRSERLRDRFLLFDSRNETEAIKIKFKETSPKPKHSRRNRSSRENRGQEASCGTVVPQPRRAQTSPYDHAWSQSDHVHAAEAATRQSYEECLALASLMYNGRLQSALQMQYPPASAFPYHYQAECYSGVGMDHYGNPYAPYSFTGSPAVYPTQAGPRSVLPQSFDDMHNVPQRWLGYRDW